MTYSREILKKEAISKIILSGEHAVVYGTPAIALPVKDCRASTSLRVTDGKNKEIVIKAGQLNKTLILRQNEGKNEYEPLELTVLNFFKKYAIPIEQNFCLEIISDIPISSGMGSGAAIAASMIKVLAEYYKIQISNEEIFNQVFEIEKIYHGNPSGVDPKVIIYEKPVFFVRNGPLEFLDFNAEFTIAIIDSAIKSSTRNVVEWVALQKNIYPEKYENIFNNISGITINIKKSLEENNIIELGGLMTRNHFYLQEMGVSNQALDELVSITIKLGAKGAKLSGAGWGGIVIALLENEQVEKFKISLESSGVKNIRFTSFGK